MDNIDLSDLMKWLYFDLPCDFITFGNFKGFIYFHPQNTMMHINIAAEIWRKAFQIISFCTALRWLMPHNPLHGCCPDALFLQNLHELAGCEKMLVSS